MAKHDERVTTELLLDHLARPGAYPHGAGEVQVVQTHISIVFLAGAFAYKVKKPVRLDFLDFSTLERRRRLCHEEVRLNRRLAPGVYHGVVAVVRGPEGLRVLDRLMEDIQEAPAGSHAAPEADQPGDDRPVEWAVRMTRLPEDRTLKALVRSEEAGPVLLDRLAKVMATFHAGAERGGHVSRFGSYRSVSANARENFQGLEAAVGTTLSRSVLERLSMHSERGLLQLRPLIERRARQDIPCDTHGDLRLGHVYHLEEDPGPGDASGGSDRLVVIDCIEFSDRFRYADPIADIAFLAMELEFEDRPDLAQTFVERYLEHSGDHEARALLSWYVAYREIVRGKVRTLEAEDPDVPREAREQAAARARRHFLRALGRLAPRGERPCLVLLAGLPGVGKSALGRRLAEEDGFVWIDTDRVRKRLAEVRGAAPRKSASGELKGSGHGSGPESGPQSGSESGSRAGAAAFEAGIYTREWTERTYFSALHEARDDLFLGKRVLVEGSFRREHHRAEFLKAAREDGVPAILLLCEAGRDVVRERLDARRDDVSDADWRIFLEVERRWEEVGSETAPAVRRIRTDGPARSALRAAREVLTAEELL